MQGIENYYVKVVESVKIIIYLRFTCCETYGFVYVPDDGTINVTLTTITNNKHHTGNLLLLSEASLSVTEMKQFNLTQNETI